MKRILFLCLMSGLVTGAPALAGSLTVPNTFVGGQKALAREVNKNFTAVKTEVDDNAADISKNASDINSNAASITNINGDLDDKVDALTCSNGQMLKYNAATTEYECADDLDTTSTNALTLEGRSASDFADSVHQHDATDIQQTVDAMCYLSRATGVDLLGYEFRPNCSQYVFVTSTTHRGDFGEHEVGNTICQSLADSANLPGVYKAWLASGNTNNMYYPAGGAFTISPYPYISVNGTVIANSWGDLTDGSIINPINIDENGNTVNTNTDVWTNVSIDGSYSATSSAGQCAEWLTIISPETGYIGSILSTNSGWTNVTTMPCNNLNRIYCFQQ